MRTGPHSFDARCRAWLELDEERCGLIDGFSPERNADKMVNRKSPRPNLVKKYVHLLGRTYIDKVCRSEAASQQHRVNERPVEYRFALATLTDAQPRTILDVGTGTTAWPALLRTCGYIVTAIDNVRDYWPEGMVNRHWPVEDVNILKPGALEGKTFDAITCISVLEHIEDHVAAVKSMTRLLTRGGVLVLTTPFSYNTPYPNCYDHSENLYGRGNPYICRSSSERELKQWMSTGLELRRRELWRMFTGPVWATGQRCEWSRVESENEPHQLGCFVFRKP